MSHYGHICMGSLSSQNTGLESGITMGRCWGLHLNPAPAESKVEMIAGGACNQESCYRAAVSRQKAVCGNYHQEAAIHRDSSSRRLCDSTQHFHDIHILWSVMVTVPRHVATWILSESFAIISLQMLSTLFFVSQSAKLLSCQGNLGLYSTLLLLEVLLTRTLMMAGVVTVE